MDTVWTVLALGAFVAVILGLEPLFEYLYRRSSRLEAIAVPDPEIELIVQELDDWLDREPEFGEGGQVPRNGSTIDLLRQFATRCQKVALVGSARRGKENPGDVDILYIPKSTLQVIEFMEQIADDERLITKSDNVRSCTVKGQKVDFIESAANQWGWDLLAYTGSRDFNERVRRHARRRGYEILSDGRPGTRRSDTYGYTEVATFHGWTEEKILAHLGLEAFLNPRSREIPALVEASEIRDHVRQLVKGRNP